MNGVLHRHTGVHAGEFCFTQLMIILLQMLVPSPLKLSRGG